MQTPHLAQFTEIWPQEVPGCTQPKDSPVVNPETGHIVKVTNPTLEEFRPSGPSDLRCAIIVCPGGAYQKLAYQHEGGQIARWLSAQGYTAYVLAYRVPDQREGALQDIFRAIRLVRHKGFARVGVIGFSAGANLCCQASARWKQTLYPPMDCADGQSQRPDFALLIYPAYLNEGPSNSLSPEITVGAHTPPLFVFGTQDDKRYSCPSCLSLLQAVHQLEIPLEMHFLPRGGHGYGMQGDGAGRIWPGLAMDWLSRVGQF